MSSAVISMENKPLTVYGETQAVVKEVIQIAAEREKKWRRRKGKESKRKKEKWPQQQ